MSDESWKSPFLSEALTVCFSPEALEHQARSEDDWEFGAKNLAKSFHKLVLVIAVAFSKI